MFVEIAGKEKQIYVGQSLDLTLKIWLRPYRDREREITLSEADMWQLISERTSWGVVRRADSATGRRTISGRSARKCFAKTATASSTATICTKSTPRSIRSDQARSRRTTCKIVVDYPTALGESRDPFASFFDDMPIPAGVRASSATTISFAVRLATDGSVGAADRGGSARSSRSTCCRFRRLSRPADYRGAVGKYRIATEASPTNVKAGDPINLLIGIAGTGPMELVQAPPLAELPELTADFKVPNEPLAGFVKGDRKVFSTTIRPRKEGITQIPAIPFSYFDPESRKVRHGSQ